nr:MAG TPA: RNA polymerase [Caudoviricetes sp.]
MMKKLFLEIETYSGIDPRSSLNRCIKAFIDGEDGSTECD